MKKATGGFLAIFLFLCLFAAPSALSWRVWQHEVIAEVAEHYLLPETREEVRCLLGPRRRMADEAGWADRIRGWRRRTAPWHYLNWPLELEEPDFDVFSTERGNVVWAIEEQLPVFRDRERGRRKRREALKFVIHLVGDLHQPLHVGTGEDRGGNDVPVRFRGRTTNLHTAWDGKMYDDNRDSPGEHAARLLEGLEEEDRVRIMSGRPYDWALESHRIVREFVYPALEELADHRSRRHPPEISGPYAEAARPVMRRRMLEAGLRLAYLLNQAVEPSPSPSPFSSPEAAAGSPPARPHPRPAR